jgi:hypothetical protein
VCEWPSEGIELTRQEIDAHIIRNAADRAEVLWEDEGVSSGHSTAYVQEIAASEIASEDR